MYTLTGACPRCGAPIFAQGDTDGPLFTEPPVAHYTCDCRHSLPHIPQGDIEQPGTVAQGDKRFVDQLTEEARGRRSAQ